MHPTRLCESQGEESVLAARSIDGSMVKLSNVEATGSGGSRVRASEARTQVQVAAYGARPCGRPRRPSRAKPQRHLILMHLALTVIDSPAYSLFYAQVQSSQLMSKPTINRSSVQCQQLSLWSSAVGHRIVLDHLSYWRMESL